MKISVILPTYNRAASLAEAIDCVLDQTVPPHELIVIDDGSTDDTAAVLARYGDRIRAIRCDNGGVARARNIGMRAATGDWLAFQDSDDLWSPDHLAVAARDLAGAGADVVAHLGNVVYVGEGYRSDLFSMKGAAFPADRATLVADALRLVISGMTLQGSTVRREVALRLGGFDETMRMLSDSAFFCKLALQGPFLATGATVAEIRRLEGDDSSITSLHRKKALYARQMHVRYLDALVGDDLTPAQRRLVNGRLSGALFRMAEVERLTDRGAALRTLARSARLNPSAVKGWGKAALAALGGAPAYRWLLRRNAALDRS